MRGAASRQHPAFQLRGPERFQRADQGRPDVSLSDLRALISVQKGQPLSRENVNATVAALREKGRFEKVGVDLEPTNAGVSVAFILEPAVYIGVYEFPGATKEFDYPRLLQVANYSAPAPYSADDVSTAEAALVKFLRQHGYFKAEVRPEVVTDKPHMLANVIFHVDLGVQARFGKINLTGASESQTRYLRGKLHSLMARLRTASLKTGSKYSFGRLQHATQYMQSALVKEHYLASDVKLVAAEYDPETNRADITFKIDTGEIIDVKATGAHIWGRTLRNQVPIYQENAVDDELIQEGQRNIQSYFQSKGYFDAKVATETSTQPSGMSIVYDITKDGRHKVSDIRFAGNTHIDEDRLRTQLTLEKAHFFSHGKFSDQLVRSSAANLRNYYRAAGYSHAEVVPKVSRPNGNVEVTFQVTEGPLEVVKSLRIEGNTTLSQAELAPKGLKLGPGKPYSQSLVTQDRNRIIARYLTLGYLNASFHSTAREIPGDPNDLDVVYNIVEGPKVVTATIITDGRSHTTQDTIDRQLKVRSGAPLSENSLLSSESRLYDLGIFDWAQVDPKRAITDQHQEDVVVKVHEAKRNSIVYGFGFEVINRGGSVPSGTVAVPGIPVIGLPNNFRTSEKTFWGPRGTFEYTRRNLRGRAESYTVSAFAGRLDQRAAFAYTDPYFLGSQWKGSAIFSVEHDSENPIYTARLGNAGYQWERALDSRKKTHLFLRYNFQVTRISKLLIPDLVPADQLSVHLSTVSATWIHDTRDNVLDAHRGIYQSYEIAVNPSWLGSNFSFARFLGQTSYYKNIGGGIIWANSLRLGLEQAYAGSEVPLSERFFSGGGSTLRGFPLNGAGPQRTIAACGDPNNPATCTKITVPDGGNELLILNTELRFPLTAIKKGLGLVTFYDGGNVYPRIGFHDFTQLYSNNVGIGFRYATPVGPIRLDIGHNLNPVPGIKSTQIFVTLGQAF